MRLPTYKIPFFLSVTKGNKQVTFKIKQRWLFHKSGNGYRIIHKDLNTTTDIAKMFHEVHRILSLVKKNIHNVWPDQEQSPGGRQICIKNNNQEKSSHT